MSFSATIFFFLIRNCNVVQWKFSRSGIPLKMKAEQGNKAKLPISRGSQSFGSDGTKEDTKREQVFWSSP